MAVLSPNRLHIALPTHSLRLEIDASSSLLASRRCCCSLRQEAVAHCSSSSRLGARFRAQKQMRGLQRARAAVSHAAAMQSEAEDDAAEAVTMSIKMEGTLADATESRIAETLEGMEGVSNVKVSLEAGMATVELTKKTTTQATGAASELVDAVQEAGFKVQSLCMGFDDEETNEDDALYFGSSSAMDEEEIAAI